MGRNSRSRQVQQKKKDTASSAGGSGPIKDTEVSGSLMSMRQGLKKVAGTGDEKKTSGANILVYVVLGAIVVVVVLMLAR